ncbi:MAG: heavy-metal-associated domain-containing protein [Cryobacterium sp.]|nr:heavy-metal-associated domain-containing protein [Cryobacterium sp.]
MTNPDIRDLGLADANPGCSCCAPGNASVQAETSLVSATETVEADFFVDGMTCSHCVSSVTEELNEIEGVSNVRVDLDAGGTSRVTVASASQLDTDQVRRAIEEAGYALAASS